ncbi:IQ domain-containing protein IQM1 [Cinnamomum micranthum f. kanehirae]|uniref:IQ domain-containing protein IQM1 n=1 Tax=Cinnamomum micranthum f. kanehirae TaxID=337451 RepID=A0A443N569_9MAGN|nr:IQ domain-containing protein IQM1 [Cinnamomum micranthum f. kanehirae]
MGLSFSSLLSPWKELLRRKLLDSYIVGALLSSSFRFSGTDAEMNLVTSSSYKAKDCERKLKSNGCGKITIEHSLSFKNWEPEMAVSIKMNEDVGIVKSELVTINRTDSEEVLKSKPASCFPVSTSPMPMSERDAAAVKLQKVYKSYRTRRNLADCAVVIEELWWKALDSAALEQSSVLFFNIKKPQTAVTRWARAKTRVAKVGKGLSKDEKARKLALQHWLEAIDPRHRYGHNLHLYYDVWFDSKSTQPFFYWLDVGDGKEVNLERSPRSVLNRQCIKYLGSKEREAYEVIVDSGMLVYRQSGMAVNTLEGSKWIFVLSTSRELYVGQKKKGTFQHSSFLSGGATTAAGRLVAENGVLKAIWPYSGHYLPTEENFKEFISFLEEHNVDLTNVKRCAADDDSPPGTAYDEHHQEEASVRPTSSVMVEDAASKETDNAAEVTDIGGVNMEAPAFRLGKAVSCKWSTGTGPRIGIVRDYPTELQSRALEQVNLSPRVTPGAFGKCGPIPSPRPSPKVRLSPRLAYMGLPSPKHAVPRLAYMGLPSPKQAVPSSK